MKKKYNISVIIPIYNECQYISRVTKKVLKNSFVKQLILVDDYSTDGTWPAINRLAKKNNKIIVCRHKKNMGKGAALKTGIRYISEEIVILQDADLEYDPTDYTKVLQPFQLANADVVYGSRFLGSGMHRVLYFWHFIGNQFLTLLSNMFTNLNLTDMETGCKAFKTKILNNILIQEDRFGFEPEITAKIARLNVILYEVSISYFGRTYKEGKKIGWKDGVWALWCILKYNLLGHRFCKKKNYK